MWRALDPAIYLISVLPGLTVFSLAYPPQDVLALVLACLGVVLLQHAVNVFNDEVDWRRGADAEKWHSWVRVQGQELHKVRLHGCLSLLAAAVCGGLALHLIQAYWILLLALPFIAMGLAYNFGSRPLAYTRAGEWVTGLCYGPGVVGGLWLVAGAEPRPALWLFMLAFGALAVSILLAHQPPQIDSDRAAGKSSFAVRHGAAKTRLWARTQFALFGLGVVSACWFERENAGLCLLCALIFGAGIQLLKNDFGPAQVLQGATPGLIATSGFMLFTQSLPH